MSLTREKSKVKARAAVGRRIVRHADATSNRIVAFIGIAPFGPYIGATGLRTEQLAVYGLLLLTLPFVLPRLNAKGGLRFLLPWTLYVLVATLGVIFPSRALAPYTPGSVFAGYDNVLLPIAAMLLVWALIPVTSARSALLTFAKVIAVAAAVNGAIALIATRVNLEPILRPFWTSSVGDTVAARAAELGRLGGIFNQPAEAGTMYGLAAVAAIYAWQKRPALLAFLLTLITLGGLLSVSKAFILGALPFVLIYWLLEQQGKRLVVALLALILAVFGVVQSGLLDEWGGANYLARLLNPTGGLIGFYTAGRFEDESTFNTVVGAAWDYSPVVGVGAGGWAVPYDGAIAETLVVAGVLGLVPYGAVLIAMLTLRKAGGSEGRFGFFLAVIVVTGALGFSPLTANRVSTVVWMFIALLVLVRRAPDLMPVEPAMTAHAATPPVRLSRVK